MIGSPDLMGEPLPGAEPPRPLPALARAAPRLFYGWIVVAGAGLLAFVTVGVGFYGQAVLLDGLSRLHGWSRAEVAGASSLYFIVAGLAGPGVGRAVDRWGAQGPIVIGSLGMAAGLVWVGHVRSLPELRAAFVLLALGFAFAGSVPNNAIITRWFVALRARALSISQTGVSLGGIVLVPATVWLIERFGLEVATSLLAALVAGVAIPVALGVIAWDPRAHGLSPDGGRLRDPANPLLSDAHQERVWGSREVLATRSFWLLAAAFAAVLFSQMSVMIHEISLMREHMSARAASFALAATAGASVLGRFAGGAVADRIDKRVFGIGLFVVQALAIALLSQAESPAGLYAAAVLLGLTIGNVFMLQSLLVGELFGIPSFGTVYGLLQLLTQVAGGAGPYALGLLYQGFGGYRQGLLLMAAVSLLAAALLTRVRAPRGVVPTVHGRVGREKED